MYILDVMNNNQRSERKWPISLYSFPMQAPGLEIHSEIVTRGTGGEEARLHNQPARLVVCMHINHYCVVRLGLSGERDTFF